MASGMWLWLSMLSVARADALIGVDWVPLGRADIAWIEDGQMSDTLVSEGDGLLDPPLTWWAAGLATAGPDWAA